MKRRTRRDGIGDVVLDSLDVVEEALDGLASEGRMANDHAVEGHSHRPDVHLLSTVALSFQLLWGQVAQTSHRCAEDVPT